MTLQDITTKLNSAKIFYLKLLKKERHKVEIGKQGDFSILLRLSAIMRFLAYQLDAELINDTTLIVYKQLIDIIGNKDYTYVVDPTVVIPPYIIIAQANSLPKGGLKHQVLKKSTNQDYLVEWDFLDSDNIESLLYTKLIGAPTSLPPSGVASGDLSGSFPNPIVNTINGITKSFYDPTSSIQTQLNSKTNLDGTGATGNWGINILGNAATVTNGIYTTGLYTNPSWINSLAWSKLISTPTTLSGYGITDGITNSYFNTNIGTNTQTAIDSKLDLTKKSPTLLLSELRSISNPQSDVIYQTKDFGGGQWYYDALDTTSSDNTGTIVVSGTKRFKRIYQGKVVYVDWFGADKTGTTDSFTAIQSAINFIAGNGTVKFSAGTYYLNTLNGGGLVLPTDASGLIIEGEGNNTIIKCSVNVPRVFDLISPSNVNNVNLYSNITLRKFKVDNNNISGISVGPALSVISVGSTSGGWTDINVSDTTGYLLNGRVAFPYTNIGTTKGQYRTFRLKSGSTTVIQVQLVGAETVLAGDIIQGGMRNHILIGMSYDDYYYNINVDGLTIQDIDIINILPAEVTSTPFADKAATKREAIYIQSGSSGVDYGFGGYSGQLYAKNILIERVRVYGGAIGFAVGGGQLTSNLSNYYLDNIVFRDCYHDTLTIPTHYYSNVNYIIGNKSFGRSCLIERCVGYNSADVGIETDALTDVKVINCDIYNSFNAGYFCVNYSLPQSEPGGPSSSTLTGTITSGATTLTVAAIPAKVALSGYIRIDSEVMYYTSVGTTLTLTRGVNSTTAASHTSGTIVYFIEVEKQLTKYIKCRYTNNSLFDNSGCSWRVITDINGIPPSPIYIEDCYYEKTTPYSLGSGRGEVVTGLGNINYDINGLVVKISGIDISTAANNNSGSLYFQNTVYDVVNGTNSAIPPAPIKLRNIDITSSGKLDAAALLSRYEIFVDNGNWALDFDRIKIRQNLQSSAVSGGQSTGIYLGTSSASYISGIINNYKYSANGANAPIGIFMKGGATYGKLILNNLDFTEMKFGVATNNGNYKPWRVDLANINSNSIFFGEIKHSTSISNPAGRKMLKRVIVTGTYTSNLTEDYLAVNTTSSSSTINLPSVESGQTDYKTNYGYNIFIVDENLNAGINNITITPYSGEKINNSTSSIVINTNGGGYNLISIPGGWIIANTNKILTDIALAAKQNTLSGTGFIKATGSTISYDNSTYLTTASALSTYLPYSGAAGAVNLNGQNISNIGTLAATSTVTATGNLASLNGRLGVNHSTIGSLGALLHIGSNSAYSTSGAFGPLNGIGIRQDALTYTSTSGSGTIAQASVNSFAIPTLAVGTAGTTISDAYTFYLHGQPVAGTNVSSITRPWTFYVNAGNSYFGGQLLLNSLTASRALVSDTSKNIIASNVTSTELGYVGGVTSAIQTQLDAKAGLATANTFTGGNQIIQGHAHVVVAASPTGNPSTYGVNGGTKYADTHDGTTNFFQIYNGGLSKNVSGSNYLYAFPNRSMTVAGTLGTLTSGALSKFDSNGNLVVATAGTDYQAPLVSATNIKTINGNSILGSGDLAVGAGTVTSVSGTANRITSTGGTTPVIDISASYVGQSSITTLGTIGSGTWQGTAIADSYISSAATWNAKQAALSGTGLVKFTGTTPSYITDNSTDWNTAYTQTRQWDGGATGLVAATGRASLGLVIGADVLAYRTFGTAANSNTGDFEVPLTFSNGLVRTTNNIAPTYGTGSNTFAQGNDSRINNGQTAFGWGNHAGLYPLYNGTGATGTWAIDISGNAATATSLVTPGYVLPYRFENGATYSATTSDSYIHVIGGACLITLPASGSGMVAGQTYIIKNKASGTTTVVMSGNAVGIDGSANTTIGVGLSKTFTYTGSYFSVID